MALGNNGGNAPNYEPNSYDNTPKQNCAYAEPALNLGNAKGDRYNHHQGNDDYTQAGDLYRLMTPDEQERLVQNIVGSLSGARQEIQMRQLCHFFRADVKYGMRIAQGQDLRNCHKRSRNSATLSAKKLKDKQRNNWALQLFN